MKASASKGIWIPEELWQNEDLNIKLIDNKYKQWEDSDMRRYLRPVTLISEKFERYLNEEIIVEKKSFVSVLKNKSGQDYDNNFKHQRKL